MFGLIGKKVGMTQIFDDTGRLVPVTVLSLADNVVVGRRTVENDGYDAVVLGAEVVKAARVTKPRLGQFPDGVEPRRALVEFRDFGLDVEIGQTLGVDVFNDVTFVDVMGRSKGKGYQGVMKRHGFGGGRKTHGSKFHRTNGSTGMAAWPSKVIKGTKMPGRMGNDRTTVLNLRVVRIDAEQQLLLVRGAVPGKTNATVRVRPAIKRL